VKLKLQVITAISVAYLSLLKCDYFSPQSPITLMRLPYFV